MPQQSGLVVEGPVATGIKILRTVSVIVLVLILLVVGAVGLLTLVLHFKDRREVVLPKPTGPYAVGRTLFDWTDRSRVDPYSSLIGKHRELMVWLWYPAERSSESVTAEYIPAAWAAKLPWRPTTIPSRVRVHALADAPVAAQQKSYPLLVFSTGFGDLPSDYTVLIEDLASHGFVILGITNTYSAPAVRFPDGRVAKQLAAASFPRGPSEAVEAAGNRMVKIWAADICFALNRLTELNADPKSKFFGRFDLQEIGIFGHSFGGAAAAEACSIDPRCKAAVDVDGDLFGSVLQSGISKPILFILSDWTLGPARLQKFARASMQRWRQHRINLERQIREISRNSPHSWETHIPGTRHFNFTDVAVLSSPGMKWTGFLGPLDGRAGLASTVSCIRSFFGEALNSSPTALELTAVPAGCHFHPLGASGTPQ